MAIIRTLAVADDYPWPPSSGSLIRLSQQLAALAELGPVDLFSCLSPYREGETEHPPKGTLSRFKVVKRTSRPKGIRLQALRIRAATKLSIPRHLSIPTTEDARVRSNFLNWVRPDYDLVFFAKAAPYFRFQDLVNAPIIVDLDDLESVKLSSRLTKQSITKYNISETSPFRRTAGPVKRLLDRWDVVRWRRLELAIAKKAHTVFVCSEVDRLRLNAPNCVVVPNGYELNLPIGRSTNSHPPTLTYIGLMSYEPNRDGACFLVNDILPKIRAELPQVELRIVGHFYYDQFAAIVGLPRVTATGFLSDLTPELTRADVAVVPLRFGSGTRIKILEAFAYRIPVVSTSAGCEGLGALHYEHLLVADDPNDFATACLRLLRDPSERARIGNGGYNLWNELFRWPPIRRHLAEVVKIVVSDDNKSKTAVFHLTGNAKRGGRLDDHQLPGKQSLGHAPGGL